MRFATFCFSCLARNARGSLSEPKFLGHSEIPYQSALDRWHEQDVNSSDFHFKPLTVMGYLSPSITKTITVKIPAKFFQKFSPLSKCKGKSSRRLSFCFLQNQVHLKLKA